MQGWIEKLDAAPSAPGEGQSAADVGLREQHHLVAEPGPVAEAGDASHMRRAVVDVSQLSTNWTGEVRVRRHRRRADAAEEPEQHAGLHFVGHLPVEKDLVQLQRAGNRRVDDGTVA